MATTAFLSRSPVLLNRGPGGPASLGAGFLYYIFSLTDWTYCAPSYLIVRRPPSSCGRHESHSFNPSTVKVYSDIPRPDAPVIYTGAFPILTARPGRRSIYNTRHYNQMKKRENWFFGKSRFNFVNPPNMELTYSLYFVCLLIF